MYFVDPQYSLDSSLSRLVEKIIPLCQYHDEITIFIQTYSSFEYGLTFQALCNALNSIKRDYIIQINVLDNEFENDNLSLQRLWHEVQKPLKFFERVFNLLEEIKSNRDKTPLSIIYRALITSSDTEIHSLYLFLFQKSIFPFLEMLGKWIYYGLIEDEFEEFMVKEKKPAKGSNMTEVFDWDDRFHLRTNLVFFQFFKNFFEDSKISCKTS